jgi:LacI family transcriptional regulator
MPRRSPQDSTIAPVPEFQRQGRPASLADVATLAGVSTGTVSRALYKPDMISEATRQRVVAAANRLGYVANGAARALSMRQTKTIGAIVPRFGGSSFPTMVQSLETTLAAEGYTLLLAAPEHRTAHGAEILRALLERGVDGVALLGAEQPREIFTMLAAHHTPFVMMWARVSEEGHCVGFDEYAAAAMVVDHLADLGHRQIGFIGGHTENNERARARFGGLTRAIANRGIALADQALIETEYGFKPGYDAMNQILERDTGVTAVVCGNDYLAAGALSALDASSIDVPGRLSIISFNDNDFAPYLHPPLTTVHLPIREVGEQAGIYLIARLKGALTAPSRSLPIKLMVRASTSRVLTKKARRA